mgnify:CR=1 FL=1
MRISTNQIYNQNLRAILDNQAALSETQMQLATGKKLTKPSDDPVGAAKVIRITEDLDKITQFKSNNNLLQNSLEQQDTVLSSIKTALNRARVLAVQSGSGIIGVDERQAIASEMSQIRDEVFDLMNTQNSSGEFIFAGYQSQEPAFSFNYGATGPQYVFQGDTGTNEVKISDSVSIQSTSSGQDIFENVFARKRFSLDSTSGMTANSIDITKQPTFDQFHDTYYDPVNPANNQFEMRMNGTNEIEVIQVGTGTIIDTLPFVSNQSFEYAGLELNLTGTPGQSVTISLDSPIKRNAAETLNRFVSALSDVNISDDNFAQALSDSLVGIDNATNKIALESSSLGARMNVAEQINTANLDIEIANQTARSSIQDLDYAEATTRFSLQETAFNAALATFPKVTNLSLFQYI